MVEVANQAKNIAILGSTGTIGVSALDLVGRYAEQFNIVALAAGRNVRLLAEQIVASEPEIVSVASYTDKSALEAQLKSKSYKKPLSILAGAEGCCAVASHDSAELVISAIVGFAALEPTVAAIRAGKTIGLANKEALIAAGDVIGPLARKHQVTLLPVDSEHNAIFQALHGNIEGQRKQLGKIVLTASGGPFLHHSKESLESITPEQALKHPTWSMGPKITIDSSTMINKGLEVIEATQLFGLPSKQIEVLIHPESIIHSMIEYVDGSMLAQLGVTDMRGPLAYAMAFPQRLKSALPSLDLARIGKLHFYNPDFDKFPGLKLACLAAEAGGSLPAVFNAANEVCVSAFLNHQMGYLQIAETIEKVMHKSEKQKVSSIEQVIDIDKQSRLLAQEMIKKGN